MIRHTSLKCRDSQVVWRTAKLPQDALANAEVIIQEWVETAKELGRTIPEPKGRLVYA